MPDVVIDNARATEHRAEFGGVADRLAHSGQSARLDQFGEEFQLADALEEGDFRRETGFDQRLEARLEDRRHGAPHHRLLVEQVRLAFLGETRFDQPGATATDGAAIGEGKFSRRPAGILRDRPQRDHAAPGFVQ